MKCEEYQLLIEDFADGALNPATAGLVTSHMATCARCASFSEELAREREIYARYQRDVEVTPALWSSIETRIKQQRVDEPTGLLSRLREAVAGVFAAPRLSPAFAAALVVIAVGVTVAVMTLWNSRRPDTSVAESTNNGRVETPGAKDSSPTQPPAANPPGAGELAGNNSANKAAEETTPRAGSAVVKKHIPQTVQATPAQLVREAEQKYLTAIAMLSRDVDRHRSQLDPIMLARFDASLSEIDRTIKETKRVVRENPGDPIALQYLLAAYSKKVDVLREMTTD